MKVLTTLILAAFIGNAIAAPTAETLEQKVDAGKVKSITNTPVKGIYEVITEDRMYYTNETGEFIFIGELYNTKTHENLSKKPASTIKANAEERMKLAFIEKIPSLKESAILETKGTSSRELFVFTNPDCPYCKKLEPELAKLNNVTIYRILIPATPEAFAKSVSVWCTNDKLSAWNSLISGQSPKNESCDNPINKNLTLSNKLKISGTPTLVDSKGNRLVGLRTSTLIDSFLNGDKQ